MNCPRVEQLLPLYSGGDLPSPQMNAVRAHLAACAPCQQLAAEFAASRSWLQSCAPPQFEEAFFAELRVAVRRELAADNAALGWAETLWQWLAPRWRPLLAAVGVLLLLLGGLMLSRNFNDRKGAIRPDIAQYHNDQKQSDSQTRTIGRQNDQLAGALLRRHMGRAARIAKSNDKQKNWRPFIAAPAGQTSVPDSVAQAVVSGAASLDRENTLDTTNRRMPEMLRIELQTADPNIRIIWLTPKSPGAAVTGEPLTH
jgi:hypothetical protein